MQVMKFGDEGRSLVGLWGTDKHQNNHTEPSETCHSDIYGVWPIYVGGACD